MTHYSWTQNPWHLLQTESQTKLCEYCSYQSSIAVKNWLLREVDLQNPALVTLTSKYHELQYSASIIPKSQSGTGFLRSTVSSHPRCCGSSWNRASPCAKNINPWLSATNGLINPLNHPLYRLYTNIIHLYQYLRGHLTTSLQIKNSSGERHSFESFEWYFKALWIS